MSRRVGGFNLEVGSKSAGFRLAGSRSFTHDLENKSRRAMKAAVRAATEQVLTNTLPITPIDTGLLRSSGRTSVEETQTSAGRTVVGFIEFTAPYADPVHEIPEPPSVSVGGRSAYHEPPTTSHFLEIAYLQISDDFPAMVGEFFVRELKR